jgi:hypothetical protein
VRAPLKRVRPTYACAPLLICARLGLFKPLEAHICPLRAQLCPLGVKCVPPPGMRPPHQACVPLPLSVRAPLGVRALLPGACPPPWRACPPSNMHAPPMCTCPSLYVRALGSFKPLEAHICPLGAHSCLWGSIMPPGGQVRAPPLKRVRPTYACTPPSYMCTPWALLSPSNLI